MRKTLMCSLFFGWLIFLSACGGGGSASGGAGTSGAAGGGPFGGSGGSAGFGASGDTVAGGTGGSGGSGGSASAGGASGSAGAAGTAGVGGTAGAAGTSGMGGAAGMAGSSGTGGTGPAWIAYRGTLSSGVELYATNIATATPHASVKLNAKFSNTGMVVNNFKWSPTGTHLAYLADQDTFLIEELWLVNMTSATPSAPVKINPTLDSVANVDDDYAWSPDGTKISYEADQDSYTVTELFVVDVSGATPSTSMKVNLAPQPYGDVTGHAWSPNNKWIAFRGDLEKDQAFELYVVDVSGATPGTQYKVSNASGVNGDAKYGGYAFSPDSTKLAYCADQTISTQDELYFVDLSTGIPTAPVKLNGPLPNANSDVQSLAWSPDGSRLAYKAGSELYLVSFAAMGPSPAVKISGALATGATVRNWTWSPSGLWLSMEADKDIQGVAELYVIDVSTPTPGAPIKVASMPSTGDVAEEHRWSPNSKWLTFRADMLTDEIHELFLVDMSGNTPGAPLKVSGTMHPYGDVDSENKPEFAPSSTGLVYLADQNTDGVSELFYVSLASGVPAAPVKLNGTLVFGADVFGWQWMPNGSRVAYLANQDSSVDKELFTSIVSGGIPSTSMKLNTPNTGLDVYNDFRWKP